MKVSPAGVLQPSPPRVVVRPVTRRRCKNWIQSFLDYTEQAESCIDYLRWSALSTIAGAAQRKIYMDMELYFVHSNMYVILVGPAGHRKTTAIWQGQKLLEKVPGIRMSPEAPSIVGLMDDFKDIAKIQPAHQSLNGFIWEISSLYENAKESITGFLTTIYDCKAGYRKRSRVGGNEELPAPWFNLIAGTTPTWLGDNFNKSAIEGGLVARTIFVYDDQLILKTPRPKPSPALDRLKEDLINDLAHISTLEGEFRFEGGDEGEAAQWYDAWYLDKRRFPRPADNRTTGYYMRKPQHILKVAMALSLAHKDDLLLSLEDIQLAKAFLEAVEPGMKKALATVGGNAYANDLERIEGQLQAVGEEGLSYGEILASNRHAISKKLLDEILEALVAIGSARKRITMPAGESMYYATFE